MTDLRTVIIITDMAIRDIFLSGSQTGKARQKGAHKEQVHGISGIDRDGLGGGAASAEILAMMNYESKTPDRVKALKLSGPQERRAGIAIIDVDPDSATFGKWLADIPHDPAGVSHHIFYDRTMTKAYLASLASPPLQVMDMTEFPPRLRTVEVPNCAMAEDVIFDDANEHWYLTCMMSANVWQGGVATDEVLGATLWALIWNEATQVFDASQIVDFNTMGAGVLLEMYFNTAGDRLHVTTAVPGQIHIFDTSEGPLTPTLFPNRRQAICSQLPMMVFMVGLTSLSLWILAQPIVA
jgi:hypothetical protein